MNPDRLKVFSLAYVSAVKDAAIKTGVHLQSGETIDDYALQTTMNIISMIETGEGVESVQNYYLNTHGGAFRAVGAELGIPGTVKGIQNYLDGN